MVHQYYDRNSGISGFRKHRKYTPPPANVRLQRVYVNSAFMRGDRNCETKCKLKASIASALGLSDDNVVIDAEGKLWHESRETPLAVYVHGS